MPVLILAQFAVIADVTYNSVAYLYEDFTGDGTVDVVEKWPGDSLIVYDGVSTTRLAKYLYDGANINVSKIRGGRLFYSAYNFSADSLTWRVYDNFTTLVHSQKYTGISSSPVYAYRWVDLNNDYAKDILILFGSYDSLKIYSGASPSVELATYRGGSGFWIEDGGYLAPETMVILYGDGSSVYFKVYENFTTEVFTSSVHTGSYTYPSLLITDYDGNGTKDIILKLPRSDGTIDVHVYTTTYTLLANGKISISFKESRVNGTPDLPPNRSETLKDILKNAGGRR